MPELIDRHAAIEAICGDCRSGYGGHCPHPCSVCHEIECLRKQPTIEPDVRRGEWIEKPPYKDETVKGLEFQIVCSRCDQQNASIEFDENSVPIAKTFYRTRFCPYCGARMDGGAENG